MTKLSIEAVCDVILKEVSIDYDTGLVTRPKTGKVLGTPNGSGYLRMTKTIDCIEYKVFIHKLIWYSKHKQYPVKGCGYVVDHEFGNRTDNRYSMLRYITNSQNQYNRKTQKNSKTGVSGVTWDKERGCYRVTIRYNGKIISLGRADDLLEAIFIRKKAEDKYYGKYARKFKS